MVMAKLLATPAVPNACGWVRFLLYRLMENQDLRQKNAGTEAGIIPRLRGDYLLFIPQKPPRLI
jgi:hypothetical protein